MNFYDVWVEITPMKAERMSWVGWLNFLLIQWFCVRLAYSEDDEGKKCNFTLLKWIKPLTGWRADYEWLWRKK